MTQQFPHHRPNDDASSTDLSSLAAPSKTFPTRSPLPCSELTSLTGVVYRLPEAQPEQIAESDVQRTLQVLTAIEENFPHFKFVPIRQRIAKELFDTLSIAAGTGTFAAGAILMTSGSSALFKAAGIFSVYVASAATAHFLKRHRILIDSYSRDSVLEESLTHIFSDLRDLEDCRNLGEGDALDRFYRNLVTGVRTLLIDSHQGNGEPEQRIPAILPTDANEKLLSGMDWPPLSPEVSQLLSPYSRLLGYFGFEPKKFFVAYLANYHESRKDAGIPHSTNDILEQLNAVLTDRLFALNPQQSPLWKIVIDRDAKSYPIFRSCSVMEEYLDRTLALTAPLERLIYTYMLRDIVDSLSRKLAINYISTDKDPRGGSSSKRRPAFAVGADGL